MKNEKLIKAAEEAKKDGYEVMFSIVKYENKKPLYHLVNIDVLLKFGKWPAAKIEILPVRKIYTVKGEETVIYQHGVKVWKDLPEKSINKSEALRKYK